MQKFLLVGMLLSGMQAVAMNSEDLNNFVKVAQCCIIGCEGARAFIKTVRVPHIPKDERFDGVRKSLTCFNACTVCAVGCCFMNRPVPAIIGVGCSAIGCCVDEGLLSRYEASKVYNSSTLPHCHGSFRSTSCLDQLDKMNRKSSEDIVE